MPRSSSEELVRSSPLRRIYPDGNVPALFLASKDEENAATEFSQLAQLPPGPEWLGCTGDGTGKISKAAFELLHRNFPGSE